jgi:hypothetical protein
LFVWRSSETRSCNHCYRGKAVLLSLSVFLAQVIPHDNACAMLYCHLCPLYNTFGAFPNLWKVAMSVFTSFCSHGATRLPLDGLSCSLNISRKSVKEIQLSLKCDKNNRYFTLRPIYICGRFSLNACWNEQDRQYRYMYVVTLRRIRSIVVAMQNHYHIFWVCVYSLRYSVGNDHVPSYIVICSLSGCIIFFHFIS